MTEEEEKMITRKKHPGRVAQGHKLAALMKKRKEEILHKKEQEQEQSKEQLQQQSKERVQEQSKEQLQNSYRKILQQSQTIIMFMALACLLSFPLVFIYFLHITLFSLKKPSMKTISTTKTTPYALGKSL